MNKRELENVLEGLRQDGVLDEYRKIYSGSRSNEIPRFFQPEKEAIEDTLFEFSKINGLNRFEMKYPTKQDVSFLRNAAEKICSSSLSFPSLNRISNQSRLLRYTQYQTIRNSWPDSLQGLLTAKLFIKLNGGLSSSVSLNSLFNYLNAIATIAPHIKCLFSFSPIGTDKITKDNFEQYVRHVADNIFFVKILTENDPNFYEYYIQYVINMVFVRLDPLGTKSISINKLLREKFFFQFMNIDPDEDPEDSGNRNNMFGPDIVKIFISNFQDMDTNKDGIVDAENLMTLRGIRWCRTFTDSLIANASTPPDFGWYVKMQTAYDYLGEEWANIVYFDVMDLNGDGEITEYEISAFYKEASKDYNTYVGRDPPSLKWLANETFDMYEATDSIITKQKFVTYKCTSGFVRHLVDIRGFVKWEGGEDILTPPNRPNI